MVLKKKNKKNIIYFSKSQKIIDDFPIEISDIINAELTALQLGYPNAFDALMDGDNDFDSDDDIKKIGHKGMKKTIGQYARQLTVKSQDSYRVIYVAKFADAIYILHAFKKKTEGVSRPDCETAKVRYKYLEQTGKNKK
jgi:phage-related protein